MKKNYILPEVELMRISVEENIAVSVLNPGDGGFTDEDVKD